MAQAKKFKRIKKKNIPMVTFTFPEVYGGAEFTLPSTKRLPLGAAMAFRVGDLPALFTFFESIGVDLEAIDALEDLDAEEFQGFCKHWGEASGLEAPKS